MDTARQQAFDKSLCSISGRDTAASLGPRPLAIIGARKGDELGFATVAWAIPVSHTPPMVAFSLRAKSHTFQLLQETKAFSISTPDASQISAAEACGNTSGHIADKTSLVNWMFIPEENTDQEESAKESANNCEALPALADALTVFSCTVDDIIKTGDHMLVLGKVKAAWSRAGLDVKSRIDATEALLCVQHDLFAQAHLID